MQSLEPSLFLGPLALDVELDVVQAGDLLLLLEDEVQAEDVAVPPLSARARPAAFRSLSRVSPGPTPGLSSRTCSQISGTSSALTSRSAMMDEAG